MKEISDIKLILWKSEPTGKVYPIVSSIIVMVIRGVID